MSRRMRAKRATRFRRGGAVSLSVLLLGAAATSLEAPAAAQSRTEPDLDVILRSGTVIDGTGSARYVADVGVADGHIVRVGDLEDHSADTEIDASGLVVAPGFIDVHSHGATAALRQAKSSLTQGVTTEILQPDGGGSTNVSAALSIEEGGLGINVGAYIGFNSVWGEVVGSEDRLPTRDEVASMQDLVVRGLKDGAWGVSSGLQYTPATYASTDEVISVVESARPWRTNFPNHLRSEENEVVEATEETIEIGERAGLVPVMTHMKVGGPDNWGKSEQTVGLIQDAIARGTYTAADVYPYLASQTGIQIRVPDWAQEGGREAMLERFKDPALREEIARVIEAEVLERANFDGVYFPTKQQTLAEIAGEMGVGAGEAVIRILENDGNLPAITHFGVEEDLRRIMQNPTTAIASDGGATTSNATHPRRYGSQPRVLGRHVRELGYITLEDAVRKMTGLPATMIGMVDRGFLAPGMVADITVFDPETVIDRATFDEPRQFSHGIEHVLVNGHLALRDRELTDVQAGKALRRGASMISRPMTGSDPVRASARGYLEPVGEEGDRCPVQVTFDATSDATRTNGTFVLNDRGNGVTFRGTELSMVQVADGWATITGRGKIAGEDGDRSFHVILDEKDLLENRRTTITIRVQDGYALKGVLRLGNSRVEGK